MSHRARHLQSKKCKEYFDKKSQDKKSLLYQLMSGEITLLTIIKRMCKERNIPITDKQLEEIKDKVKEEEHEAKDEEYESESEVSSEDYDEGDMIEETFTIGRTKDGHYVIM